MTKTIALLNMKGGVGKTTSSINIATGFANNGYKVLLIDLDPQANSTDILLQAKPEDIKLSDELLLAISTLDFMALENITDTNDRSSYKYIDEMLLNPELTTAFSSQIENLDIIPSRLDLANTEQEIRNGNAAIHNRLLKVIRSLERKYDYIFIDCAPVINTLTINVLNVVNDIIAPIKIDRGAEKGLLMTIKRLMEIADSYDLDIHIRPLFTMVPRNNTAKQRITALMNFNTETITPIVPTIRHQDKPVSQASYDNSLVINDAKANVGQDYRELVEYLMKELN